MGDVVEYETHGVVAVIALNNPPVNAMGVAVRQGIWDALDRAEKDEAIKAVVLTGRGRGFCGGADIREFGKPRKEPFLTDVINRVEDFEKPVVAALHGSAVGGGCELPLGCHYRVGDGSAQFGLPEIKLGLLPGAGGTQRLPRLIGIEPALDMILSGDYVGPDKAKALGFLDEVVEGDLVDGAVKFAQKLVADGKGPRRTRDMTIEAKGADELFAATRKRIARRTRGLLAPEICIQAVEMSLNAPLEDGLAFERASFDELVQSPQSKAQRHLFFAERLAHKIPDVPADTRPRKIEKTAVIGFGTMGRGIAMSIANGGLPVKVLEVSSEAVEKGLDMTRKTYASTVKRGGMSQDEMDERMGLITGTTEYADLADADIIIEAVFEEMELKKQIFAKLDNHAKPGAVLATNTSSLDIDEIASATTRPKDVIGTHFFSPANVMRLMENVRGKATAPDVMASVMNLSKAINKVGVMVGNCNGFVGNRMLYAYRPQCEYLLEEGALPEQIDRVFYEFGMPMGPFAMSDLAGLDVGHAVRVHRRKIMPSDVREPFINDRIVEMGRYGQKTGKGWYIYEDGNRTPIPDPEIEKFIVAASEELGIERRKISDQEIIERCFYTMINEGAKILGEGIAIRPSDIDLVWIYGYGFPVGKGGPMFYADTVGVKEIYDVMVRLHDKHGGRLLEPAPLLEELARDGKSFADLQS